MNSSPVTWFEIPARDLDRAAKFYEGVLGKPLQRERMGDMELAVFASAKDGVGGCVQAGDPHKGGTLVYLNVTGDLDGALERTRLAGGKIVLEKTPLPGNLGHFAHITDSEGNRVGLHAFLDQP